MPTKIELEQENTILKHRINELERTGNDIHQELYTADQMVKRMMMGSAAMLGFIKNLKTVLTTPGSGYIMRITTALAEIELILKANHEDNPFYLLSSSITEDVVDAFERSSLLFIPDMSNEVIDMSDLTKSLDILNDVPGNIFIKYHDTGAMHHVIHYKPPTSEEEAEWK